MKPRFVIPALAAFCALFPRGAVAIPYFAHEYGLACQKCHSVVPHLTAFGRQFLAHGYALQDARPQRVFPLAVKINAAYTSEPDATGLPKATLDEVELFVAGRVGSRGSYFVEQYELDGGRPGATRDAWLHYRLTPDSSRLPVSVQVGQFTLPLPVDPESFRETLAHYTIFDRSIGANPFTFFEPKIGAQLRFGDLWRGTSVALLALGGHDRQSGISARGLDTMLGAQHVLGPLTLAAYRYDGSRPTGPAIDRFWRQGYGATYVAGLLESETVFQTGSDTNFDGLGTGTFSSGGFTQLRYQFARKFFGLVRYEGTNDSTGGFTRDLVPLLGYRVSRNSRLTIEDVYRHAPQTNHTLDVQYTVAY